ncbi:MAG: dienelactone hydrolase family protein [Sphingomonas sp.]
MEIYPAAHGWANPAGKTYDAAAAERAFQALVTLFRARLD